MHKLITLKESNSNSEVQLLKKKKRLKAWFIVSSITFLACAIGLLYILIFDELNWKTDRALIPGLLMIALAITTKLELNKINKN